MTLSLTALRVPARIVALLLVLAAALLARPGPADATWNYGDDGMDCLHGYNYANPSTGYLYASTDALGGVPGQCVWAYAGIVNNSIIAPSPPGQFLTSWCSGSFLTEDWGQGFAAASLTLPPGQWMNPCSNHMVGPESHSIFNSGGLPFRYR